MKNNYSARTGLLRLSTTIAGLVLLALVAGDCVRAGEPAEPLVLVNGEPILASDLDQAILQLHQRLDAESMDNVAIERAFTRVIHDELLLQEARAMELQEIPEIRADLRQVDEEEAIGVFARENFVVPSAPSEEDILQRFEQLYWKIQIRQLSMRTFEQAQEMRELIESGASMDSLAREHSLDTHRLKGGAHNLKLWADVENVLREQAKDLAEAEVSAPFPFRDSHSILRIEQRYASEPESLESLRETIKSRIEGERRDIAWAAFVDSLRERTTVQRYAAVLSDIEADSAQVFRSEFKQGTPRPALQVGGQIVSETRLRKAISRAAMGMGTSTWAEIREAGQSELVDRLVLVQHAEKQGIFARPELVESRSRRLERALIENYLAQTVAAEIVFDRQEFIDYYEEHKGQFRGPEQVKLDIMVFDQKSDAERAAKDLLAGANFDYVRQRHLGIEPADASKTRWSSVQVFSPEINEALTEIEVGQTTGVLPSSSRWMILELEGRRASDALPLEDVEMEIRRVMFQRKFNELLDERLSLLKERSEIVRFEDRIAEYFEFVGGDRPDSEVPMEDAP